MRIVYISFEYPPDNANGGIATYTYQISNAMANIGNHEVHVVCGSPSRNIVEKRGNLTIHRLQYRSSNDFKPLLALKLLDIHNSGKIDIIESPDYRSDGLIAKTNLPDVPLVVRLHGPLTFIYDYTRSSYKFSINSSMRDIIKHISYLYRRYLKKDYFKGFFFDEYQLIRMANCLHSPSNNLRNLVLSRWGINSKHVRYIPNIFVPNNNFLNVKAASTSSGRLDSIAFLGRLESFKGVLVFIDLIPILLKTYPWLQFYFIGRPSILVNGESSDEYLLRKLSKYRSAINFSQPDYREIPIELSKAQIVVLPSTWESFGYVCLEAMSAGRPVIGSKHGGMAEIIQDYKNGIIINPFLVDTIINAIKYFIDNPSEILRMGEDARQTVLNRYSANVICPIVESEYRSLIE